MGELVASGSLFDSGLIESPEKLFLAAISRGLSRGPGEGLSGSRRLRGIA